MRRYIVLLVLGLIGLLAGFSVARADDPPPGVTCDSHGDCTGDAVFPGGDGDDDAGAGGAEGNPEDPTDVEPPVTTTETPPPTTPSTTTDPVPTATVPTVSVTTDTTTAVTTTTTTAATTVETPPLDACTNLPGEKQLRKDWRKLPDGSCQPIPDLCPNLGGPQEELTSRMRVGQNGDCINFDPNADP
ncbi:hypothetical protein KW794_01860, partial [Candidatus Saccharibacteria bacterium]|nr:hypothetical protein [Candidatus Saccharibacteria bacterium]